MEENQNKAEKKNYRRNYDGNLIQRMKPANRFEMKRNKANASTWKHNVCECNLTLSSWNIKWNRFDECETNARLQIVHKYFSLCLSFSLTPFRFFFSFSIFYLNDIGANDTHIILSKVIDRHFISSSFLFRRSSTIVCVCVWAFGSSLNGSFFLNNE